MTLFKYESMDFRKSFFPKEQSLGGANFANLPEVLFGGRARLPAADFFSTRGMAMSKWNNCS